MYGRDRGHDYSIPFPCVWVGEIGNWLDHFLVYGMDRVPDYNRSFPCVITIDSFRRLREGYTIVESFLCVWE